MNPRPEPRTWILVALVLAVSLIVAFVCFVPVIECPSCEGLRKIGIPIIQRPFAAGCRRCNDRERVSILNRWIKPAGILE